jgi:two-component system, NarL family, response regulator DevR
MTMPARGQSPIKVLIIDDHKIIREGLCDLIASQPGMSVVGDAGNRLDATHLASREQPDVIVLDLDLGKDDGLEILPELLDVAKKASVIVLTGVRDVQQRDKAIELGAKGVVLKEHGATDLLKAIEKIHYTGDYWFEPGAAQRIFDKARAKEETAEPEAERIAQLTPTERELITYIGKGLDNRKIAAQMHIAESTVRNNLTRIYSKLEIQGGRLALLVYAYQHGLVKRSS